MGFPGSEANWEVITGAMYMGADGGMPFIFTCISAAICVYVLLEGNRQEKAKYDAAK